MGAIIYLLQVAACTAIFYGFYYFMLSRLTFFTINRWYLLTTIALSFIIPLLTITVKQDYAPVIKQVVYINQLQAVPFEPQSIKMPIDTQTSAINWAEILKMIYLGAVLILSVRLVIILLRFFKNIKSRKSTSVGKIHIVKGNKKLHNGSFLNYIFLNEDELNPDELQQIIAHEMLHVKLLHSVDRIIAKIAQIVLWFNPFIYLYARAIEENHEFEVDREIGQSTDKTRYADMLLHLSVAGQGLLYHSFSKVPLKRRITMLFTKPTNHMKKVIYLFALPMVMLSCLAFARLKNDLPVKHEKSQKNKAILPDTDTGIVATITKNNKVVGVVKYPPAAKVLTNSEPVKPVDTNKAIFATITKNNKVVGVVKLPPNATVSKAEPKTDYETQENTRSTTAAEKRIIAKALEDPAAPFFSRFHFQREGGNGFDVIAFKLGNGGGTANLDAGGKAAAFIDGKFYNEDNLKKLTPEKVSTLVFDSAPDRSKRKKIAGDDNYAMPFSFKTKTAETPVDTIKTETRPTPAARPDKPQKPKSTAIPAVRPNKSFLSERSADHKVLITIDSAADAHNRLLTQEVIKRIHHKQFYNRIKFTAFDGKNYDYVACAIGKNLTTAPIKLNAKVGLLIDGIFYDEEAIKKLPESKTQKLEMWHEGFNAKKIPEGNYAVPFSFKTKGYTAPADTINYRQRNGQTNEEYNKTKADQQKAYNAHQPEIKKNEKLLYAIYRKQVDVVVKDVVKIKDRPVGFTITHDGNDYFLRAVLDQEKQLLNLLKVGDKIKFTSNQGGWGYNVLMVSAGTIYKNDKLIYQYVEPKNDNPFGFEVNKVRFTEGKVTEITKYATGKWKSAWVVTANGYHFNINFKPNAPDLRAINKGGFVQLRFVHEVKTADRTYQINDWVAITTNIRDYQNPDFFYKFYTPA